MINKVLGAFLGLAILASGQQAEIGKTYKDSKGYWPPEMKAPKGAPNIVWIVLDDVGFGQFSTFG